jgi:dihydrofolate reductase
MQRPRVSVFIAASIDGYIARDDGSIDFLDCVAWPGEDYGYANFFAQVDTLVVGRNTWEAVRGFPEWPWSGKRVVVLTHRVLPAQHGEETHAGDLRPLLRALQAQGVRRIYLDGGIAIRQGLREGVVDDMTVSTIPLLLGSGRALFGDTPLSSWDLDGIRHFPSGLVQCTWKARELPRA